MSTTLEKLTTDGLAAQLATLTDAELRTRRDKALITAQVFHATGDTLAETAARNAWRALVAELGRRYPAARGL